MEDNNKDFINFSTYTDKNGNFKINVTRDVINLEVTKKGFNWNNKNNDSGDRYKSYDPGISYNNELFEMDCLVKFNPILKSRQLGFMDDTLWIDGRGYLS
ncbi:MAG TPA: hypothetical protein VIK55_19740 [Paludibacter sp.]